MSDPNAYTPRRAGAWFATALLVSGHAQVVVAMIFYEHVSAVGLGISAAGSLIAGALVICTLLRVAER